MFKKIRSLNLKLTLFLALALLLSACISTSSEPEIRSTRVVPTAAPATATVPASAEALLPAAFDPLLGAELYATNCAPCHGAEGLGDGATAAAFVCEMPAFADYDPETRLTDWYQITAEGNRGDPTCLMPPWSGRLNPAQMWQAVGYAFSLRYDDAETQRGLDLLTAIGQNPAYFADLAWHVENTDAEISAALAGDGLEGLTLNETLSAEDERALLAAIRSLVYVEGGAEVAALPAPIATEEASDSAPIATEEAESSAPIGIDEVAPPLESILNPPTSIPTASPIDSFTLMGRVVNGTIGGETPPELPIILRVAGLNAAGQPEQRYLESTVSAADGSFTFENVPRDPQTIASLQTEYAGLRQQQVFSPSGDLGGVVAFTVYETTSDPSAIQLQGVEVFADAVTAEGASLFFQTFSFINVGDRIFTGLDGRTLVLPLPQGAVNPDIDTFGMSPGRFELAQEGGQSSYYDSQPVFPGAADSIVLQYNFPYEGRASISQRFPYQVGNLNVYVNRERGLEINSPQFSRIESQIINGLEYQGYSVLGLPLPPDTAVNYEIRDGAATASTSSESSTSEGGLDTTQLILGIGILLIIAGAMFMVYDLRKTRLLAGTRAPAPIVGEGQEALLMALAKLDEAYALGQLDEAEYQQERDSLKKALRRSLE